MKLSKFNPEGYPDPTAYEAIKRAEKTNKKLKISESDEQITLFGWAAWNEKRYPGLELMHHIPNGGARHISTAKRLKVEGVKPGVPDICLPVPRGEYHGLYIELKAKTGYKIEPEQTSWIMKLREQGYYAVFCYGADDAQRFIEWYMKGATDKKEVPANANQ